MTVRGMEDEAEAWRPKRGGDAAGWEWLRGGSHRRARRVEGGDFASHVYVGRSGRALCQLADTVVRCGTHGCAYVYMRTTYAYAHRHVR